MTTTQLFKQNPFLTRLFLASAFATRFALGLNIQNLGAKKTSSVPLSFGLGIGSYTLSESFSGTITIYSKLSHIVTSIDLFVRIHENIFVPLPGDLVVEHILRPRLMMESRNISTISSRHFSTWKASLVRIIKMLALIHTCERSNNFFRTFTSSLVQSIFLGKRALTRVCFQKNPFPECNSITRKARYFL